MSNRWKIKRDVRKEDNKLGQEVAQASEYMAKEKKYSKNVGMLGALLAPMIVATTIYSGGAAMPLWAGALAAGGGALAGAKLGEEMAEGFKLGEDDVSKGKTITKGKFNKSDRRAVKSSLIDMANDLDKGMVTDAGIAAATYAVKVGGKDLKNSLKGVVKGTIDGGIEGQQLVSDSKSLLKDTVFGSAEDKALNQKIKLGKQALKETKIEALALKKEKFADIVSDKVSDSTSAAGAKTKAEIGRISSDLKPKRGNNPFKSMYERMFPDTVPEKAVPTGNVDLDAVPTDFAFNEQNAPMIDMVNVDANKPSMMGVNAPTKDGIRRSAGDNMLDSISKVKPNTIEMYGGMNKSDFIAQQVDGFMEFGKSKNMINDVMNVSKGNDNSMASLMNLYTFKQNNTEEEVV